MKSFAKVRLLAIGVVGVGLILTALGYSYFVLARPVGSGPAGPAVAGQPFEKIWSERRVNCWGSVIALPRDSALNQ